MASWARAVCVAVVIGGAGAGCRDDVGRARTARDAGVAGTGGWSGDAGGGGDGGAIDGGDLDAVEAGTPLPAFAWRNLSPCEFPKSAPIYDFAPMLAFDRDRRKLVLYGGHSRNDALESEFIIPSPPGGNLWEMDATSGAWMERTACPPVSYYAGATGAMIYDAHRRRLVVFAGPNGDAGEWDPATGLWTDWLPAGGSVSAPVGLPHLAVYDEARGKAIVFVLDDLEEYYSAWEWDLAAGSWTLRTTDLPPFRRPDEKPGVAYDGDRGVLWLFGAGGGELLDHLWRWDVDDAAAVPVDVTPAVRPAAWPSLRFGSGLAYDAGRGRLVLYGGVADDYLRDLWEWDPTTSQWQNRTPAAVTATGTAVPDGIVWPPAGLDANRIFVDPTGGQVLLYDWGSGEPRWAWDGQTGTWSLATSPTPPRWPPGGSVVTAWNGDDRSLLAWAGTDLWRWTPEPEAWELLTPPAWAAVAPASRDPAAWPEPRSDTAAAYDRGAGKLVMFGGLGAGGVLGDLWLWDPLARKMTSSAPPSGDPWPGARSGHALAYDPVRQRVLLFGGGTPDALDDLWALDTASARWEDLTPPASARGAAGAAWPPARAGHGFVLDADRQVLVLAGGFSGTAYLGDVWELDAGGSSWRLVASAGTRTDWPVIRDGDPVTFAAGLGLYIVAPMAFGGTALWRWDPGAGNWTTAGLALPRDLGPLYSLWLAGIDDGLLFLATNPAPPWPEDQFFFETWRASPAP